MLPDHLLIQPILKYNTDCEVLILGSLVDNIIKGFYLPSRLLDFSQARYYLANKKYAYTLTRIWMQNPLKSY